MCKWSSVSPFSAICFSSLIKFPLQPSFWPFWSVEEAVQWNWLSTSLVFFVLINILIFSHPLQSSFLFIYCSCWLLLEMAPNQATTLRDSMVLGEPWHSNSEMEPAALPSLWTSEAPHVIPLGAPGFLCQHWPWEWDETKVMLFQLSGLKTFWSLKTWGLQPFLFIGAASISSHCIRDQNWDLKNNLFRSSNDETIMQ